MKKFLNNSITKCFQLEFYKERHMHNFLLLIITDLLISLMLYNGLHDTASVLPAQMWLALFYRLPLMNTILLPALWAVLASNVMDLEHKSNMWKILESITSKKAIYYGKILYGLFFSLLFSLIEMLSLILLCFVIGIHIPFPAADFVRTGCNVFLVCFILYLLQSNLSLLFHNQYVSFSTGLAGSLFGLFIMYLPFSFLYYTPWGISGITMFVGMDYDSHTRLISLFYSSPFRFPYMVCLLWILLLTCAGQKIYEKMEEGHLPVQHQETKRSHTLQTRLPIEMIKLKRSPVWIPFILLPLISAIIGTINFKSNLGVLSFTWESLWTQHTLFLSFLFISPLIALIASCMWRTEHAGTNWNLVMTNESYSRLVFEKLAVIIILMALEIIWIALLFIFSGIMLGLHTPLPHSLFNWLICGFLGSITICTLQSLLSLIIHNFAIPIGISFFGGFTGLILTAKGYGYLLPYSLFCIGMRSNNPNLELALPKYLLCCCIYITLFLALHFVVLKYTDTKTQS